MTDQSRLSLTYRRYLSLYPRQWRVRNGEAMVGLLLEQAAAERRGRPSLRDRLDLIAGAFAARLTFWDRRGRAAETSFGLGLGLGLVYLGVSWDTGYRSVIGPFANPTFVAVSVWVAAYLCLLAGHVVAARRAVLAAVALQLLVGALTATPWVRWYGPSVEFTIAFSILGVLSAARPVRRRALLTTLLVVPATVISGMTALTSAFAR